MQLELVSIVGKIIRVPCVRTAVCRLFPTKCRSILEFYVVTDVRRHSRLCLISRWKYVVIADLNLNCGLGSSHPCAWNLVNERRSTLSATTLTACYSGNDNQMVQVETWNNPASEMECPVHIMIFDVGATVILMPTSISALSRGLISFLWFEKFPLLVGVASHRVWHIPGAGDMVLLSKRSLSCGVWERLKFSITWPILQTLQFMSTSYEAKLSFSCLLFRTRCRR